MAPAGAIRVMMATKPVDFRKRQRIGEQFKG